MFNEDVKQNKIRTNIDERYTKCIHMHVCECVCLHCKCLPQRMLKCTKSFNYEEWLKGDAAQPKVIWTNSQQRVNEISKFGTEYNSLVNNMLCPFILFVSSNCFLPCIWIFYLRSEHFHCIPFNSIPFHANVWT